jgi:WXG100 family type VII secretion target
VVDQIAIDFQVLGDGEAALERTIDAMETHLADLENCVSDLMGRWSGEAAGAYREAQREWNAAAEGMRQNLRELHDLIVTAHRNHAAALRANVKMWAL